jgi:hypothetical protein
MKIKFSYTILLLSIAIVEIGCGGTPNISTSLGPINFSPTVATIQGNSCTTNLTFINQTGKNLLAQVLNLQLVGSTTHHIVEQSISTSEVATLLQTLNLAIGSIASGALNIDVSELHNDTTIQITAILVTTTSQGNPAFFSGMFHCQR